jgi:PAS domain S-box-containing protein
MERQKKVLQPERARASAKALAADNGEGGGGDEAGRAFEHGAAPMLIAEENTVISRVNRAFEGLTGYRRDEIEGLMAWTDFLLDEQRTLLLDYHRRRRVDPDSVPRSYEIQAVHRTGAVRDLLLSVTLLPGTNQTLATFWDVTENKRTGRLLQKAEQRLERFYRTTNDIIFAFDGKGRIVQANQAFLAAFDLPLQESLPLDLRDFFVDDGLERLLATSKELRRDREAQLGFEVQAVSTATDAIWLDVVARAAGRGRRRTGVECLCRDITERKRQEQELRQREQRFRETTELLPSIICEIDSQGRLTYVNRKGLVCFGYSMADFERGVVAWDLVAPSERERAQRNVAEVLAGRVGATASYKMQRKDGTTFDALITSAPMMTAGRTSGIRSSLVDVTELRAAERQLATSQLRFRAIFEQSPLGLALADGQGNIAEANESFRTMFRLPCPPPEATGGTWPEVTELMGVEPTVLSSALGEGWSHSAWWAEPAGGGGGGADVRGERRFFQWRLSPLSGLDGEPTRLLVQVEDLTERKQHEEDTLSAARNETAEARALIANLQSQLDRRVSLHDMHTCSREMGQIFEMLPEVADTLATVLVHGESGTGKELIARALHEMGRRRSRPFVALNCSALPDNLLESELFGYKAGAFTDAKKDKPGKFALAEGGTIFLDEIGDISAAMQAKLLRVLQERVYEPLGGTRAVKADVRVITATNKDLKRAVQEGTFRQDLYYRINVVTITLPALRQRRCDIPLLCEHFVRQNNARYDRRVEGVSDEALRFLLSYPFPGNIRELENIIEHSFIFCKKGKITLDHLPDEIKGPACLETDQRTLASVSSFEELEKLFIQCVLEQMGGNRLQAARRLGVHKTTFFRKLKKHGLTRDDSSS